MNNFVRYASVYDLVYGSKDYHGEAAFVLSMLRQFSPAGKTLLELGCGTGGHAFQFLSQGLDVFAIDRSPEMIDRARSKDLVHSPRFETRNINGLKLDRKFDFVVSLFHVFSYLTKDEEVRDFLRTLKSHMEKNSVAFFDYWYAPAVRMSGVSPTKKEFISGKTRVVRTSSPKKLEREGLFDVSIKLEIFDGERLMDSFSEQHPMRSFELSEIEKLCAEEGLSVIKHGTWLSTNESPSENSWSAFTMVKRREP